MPTDLPLSTVISQVILHTPHWVWGVLALITVLGLRQLSDYTASRTRLTLVPVMLGAYSLAGITSAFGVQAGVLLAWAVGAALVVAASAGVASPRQSVRLADGRYAVPGSLVPLVAMWAMFGVRYVMAVALIMHPQWAHGTVFSVALPMVCGALTGVFLARSLRVLKGSPSAEPAPLAA